MHWILADLLMFVSSVALFLTIRKAALLDLPSQLNNLAMFGVPMLFYVGLSLGWLQDFSRLTPWICVLLVVTSIVAYVSNAASLRSIKLAPNPGYSLVISKSAVIVTVFLAVPLFGSKLTIQAVLAVLLILAFSTLIVTGPHKTHKSESKNESWLPLALVAFFGWAFLALSAKFMFRHSVTTMVFLSIFFTLVTTCIVREIRRKHISLEIIQRHRWLFLQIGLWSSIWNFFLFYALNIAPNPGYVNATNAASIAVVTLLSTLLFKDDLSWRKCLGVFGVIGGLCLLFLG
ncbi:MAG TPA: hypothetical protein VLH38_04920 [Patescibacteria group bacterium]|nr:hypothetical protein [Patescibacteria group bacterium]